MDNKEDVIDATKKYISQYIDGDDQEIMKRVKNFFNAVDCKYSIEVYNRTYNLPRILRSQKMHFRMETTPSE